MWVLTESRSQTVLKTVAGVRVIVEWMDNLGLIFGTLYVCKARSKTWAVSGVAQRQNERKTFAMQMPEQAACGQYQNTPKTLPVVLTPEKSWSRRVFPFEWWDVWACSHLPFCSHLPSAHPPYLSSAQPCKREYTSKYLKDPEVYMTKKEPLTRRLNSKKVIILCQVFSSFLITVGR